MQTQTGAQLADIIFNPHFSTVTHIYTCSYTDTSNSTQPEKCMSNTHTHSLPQWGVDCTLTCLELRQSSSSETKGSSISLTSDTEEFTFELFKLRCSIYTNTGQRQSLKYSNTHTHRIHITITQSQVTQSTLHQDVCGVLCAVRSEA